MIKKNEKMSHVVNWSNEQVVKWISTMLNYPQYAESFLKHEIDGRDLIDLTEDNLKYDLQVIKLHDRKTILRGLCALMKEYVNSFEENIPSEHTKNNANNEMIYDEEIEILYEGNKNLYWKFKVTPNLYLYSLIHETSKYFSSKDNNKYTSNYK